MNSPRLPTLLLCAAVLTAGCADLKQANDAWQTGDYSEARHHWEALAARDFPQAHYGMGRLLARGLDGPADPNAAKTAFERAYRGGQISAAYELGKLYADPTLDDHNPAKAVYWYELALRHGRTAAARPLADMYLNGQGIEQDIPTALALYQGLAKDGDISAAYRLGRAYAEGHQVEQNQEQALQWYRQAADGGHTSAQVRLADMLLTTDTPSDDHIHEALTLYRHAAAAPHAGAAYRLGTFYEQGLWVPRDLPTAMRWYEHAAAAGHQHAQLKQAKRYLYGEGVTQDTTRALTILESHAIAGNADAAYELGRYHETQTAAASLTTAAHWYQIAAERGHTNAQNRLALISLQHGGGADQASAIGYLAGQALRGNTPAAFELGRHYQNTGDRPNARHWLKHAADAGHGAAAARLAKSYADDPSDPANAKIALHYYTLAAQQGHPTNAKRLAQLHDALAATDPNHREQALHWYRRAAQDGDVQAQMMLAALLSTAGASAAGQREAVMWWEQALAAGEPRAIMPLGEAYANGQGVARDQTTGLAYLLTAARANIHGAVDEAMTMMANLPEDAILAANVRSRDLIKLVE